jgi:hypothetical protein
VELDAATNEEMRMGCHLIVKSLLPKGSLPWLSQAGNLRESYAATDSNAPTHRMGVFGNHRYTSNRKEEMFDYFWFETQIKQLTNLNFKKGIP